MNRKDGGSRQWMSDPSLDMTWEDKSPFIPIQIHKQTEEHVAYRDKRDKLYDGWMEKGMLHPSHDWSKHCQKAKVTMVSSFFLFIKQL